MAPSASTDSPPLSTPVNTENNLQPFFILHKAYFQKTERKSTGSRKTRRRTDLSPSLPKNVQKSEAARDEEWDDLRYEHLRMEAFKFVWSKIESTIKDVIRNINVNVFNEIHRWVCESHDAIRSFGMPGFAKATQPYPIVTDAASKQLFTGLVLTKNMEFVDDLLTFEELGLHLKSHGCHVANLSSLDFLAKNGIGGSLRSLLRQFLMVTLDAADISILASWYIEQGNSNNPVVVIIDDMERCCGSILSDFILMLSEWVVKIPIILIMGVATTLDAPRNILPSNAFQRLCPCKFILGSPAERMDAIVKAVLVKQCSGFSVGYKVAVFMRNYFLRQDGTLANFIRALKIACVQHFSVEPLSFLLRGLLVEEDNQGFGTVKNALLPEAMFKYAFDLPSCARNKLVEQTGENLAHGLSELKRLQECWSTVVLCLYEAGKHNKISLLDLFCEALDPDLYNLQTSENHFGLENNVRVSSSTDRCMRQQYSLLRKGSFICQAVRNVRDLPSELLCQLLKSWEKLTKDILEIHDKVNKLQSLLNSEDGKSIKQDLTNALKLVLYWVRGSSWIGFCKVEGIEDFVRGPGYVSG
ncbi:hypothetical protein L1049_002060 [Liquidambar formosana]|uniref:Origin recognition complex subunit 3 N-terminal domain-containing protein n=1 Tax=Liquidambar formosana TaxID=63359 RepID=A0AAP0NE80_LIQFO